MCVRGGVKIGVFWKDFTDGVMAWIDWDRDSERKWERKILKENIERQGVWAK